MFSPTLIANCSAHKIPSEMILYILKLPGQCLFREWCLISVAFLWAEQFVVKLWVIFQKMKKSVRTLIVGGQGGPCNYTFEIFSVKSASYSTWITRNNYSFDKKINSETVRGMLCKKKFSISQGQINLNFILCHIYISW